MSATMPGSRRPRSGNGDPLTTLDLLPDGRAEHQPELVAESMSDTWRVRAALDERIAGLEWMSEETKERAHAKLASFRAKIGYPDEWRDYSSFDVVAGDHYGNVVRGRLFETRRTFDQLGQLAGQRRVEAHAGVEHLPVDPDHDERGHHRHHVVAGRGGLPGDGRDDQDRGEAENGLRASGHAGPS